MEAYGYVETLGLVTAIEAADAAMKAADVILTNCYYVKGGIVTVEVAGDVAAVNAAVDAAAESAVRLGNFLSSNVIARVDSETKKILIGNIKKTAEKSSDEKTVTGKMQTEKVQNEINIEMADFIETKSEKALEKNERTMNEKVAVKIAKVDEEAKNTTEKTGENIETKEISTQKQTEEVSKTEISKKEDVEIKKLKKQYQDMKVVDLKMKVNNLKLGYTWNQIKTMPKKKLIEILIKNNQEE